MKILFQKLVVLLVLWVSLYLWISIWIVHFLIIVHYSVFPLSFTLHPSFPAHLSFLPLLLPSTFIFLFSTFHFSQHSLLSSSGDGWWDPILTTATQSLKQILKWPQHACLKVSSMPVRAWVAASGVCNWGWSWTLAGVVYSASAYYMQNGFKQHFGNYFIIIINAAHYIIL